MAGKRHPSADKIRVDNDPDKIRPTAAAKLLGCSHTFIYNQVKAEKLKPYESSRGMRVSKAQVLKLKPRLEETKARVFGAAAGIPNGDGDTRGPSIAPPAIAQALAGSDSLMELMRRFKDAVKALGATNEVTISGLSLGTVVIRPAQNEIVVQ